MGDIFGLIIVRPFGLILMWIYQLVGSYGLAVILFAVLAKIILFPLSYKSKKSMLKMNAVQGRLQELQKKYANNKVKLNEEMQKLYESEGVSPMSGCLPTFITLPIMMGLYYAVQKPLTFMLGLGTADIALLGNKVGIDVATVAAKSATYQLDIAQGLNKFVDASGAFSSDILNLSENIKNLLIPIDFNFFGLDLSLTPHISQPSVLWLIPILSGLTAFLSSYIMQKMQKTQAAGSMKTMLYMMPLMSVYFGFLFPASIGIYWVTNNILTTVQEYALTKYLNKRHPVLSDIEKRQKEQEEKRAAREEKIQRITEEGARPDPNTSRKKRDKK
ncbi:MAG: YidC/Oxa1 family membrane protein insertase [Clostridia bacterium]|nr:YidC/Oxa1 family membrane protein insertase [Clostridia bacterium]